MCECVILLVSEVNQSSEKGVRYEKKQARAVSSRE